MSNKMICTEVRFNYYPGSTDGEYPERYESFVLQKDGVVEIHEIASDNDGDKMCYTVVFENGQMIRIYNPCWSHLIPAS
jgi:hypothetical protein